MANLNRVLVAALTGSLLLLSNSCKQTVAPPAPYGALPSQAQLDWQELEVISIVHFGLNTFINKEWGYGDADPREFNPSHFDADQIVTAAKSAGIQGLILVAKHHDGFCLWPTKTTDYNISESPWKNGRGDMVKAFAEACKKGGIRLGLYCSPWDRNNPHYGDEKYLEIYRNQLKELYTDYGTLFESWFDGANGGDGFYGGAKEYREIDRTVYYDWDSTWNITKTLQPDAVIFSDMGPGSRWVGNEKGYAADTTWETFTPVGVAGEAPAPGSMDYTQSPTGTRDGKYWIPAECDVSLRPGWFYRPEEDQKVKSPEQLEDIYFHSVGRSGNMNLGLAPDKTGQLHENDVASLKAFGKKINQLFSKNLMKNVSFDASNVRGRDLENYGPKNLIDGDRYSYWATDEDIYQPDLEMEWDDNQIFNVVQLRENIKLGQRIKSIAIDSWEDKKWKEIATATGIGANRLMKLPQPIKTKKLRLRVVDSPVSIALSEFGLYLEEN